jgi:hypothetical protein
LLLGGAALVLLALLSLSASEGAEGKKRSENMVLGALAVVAVFLVLAKSGLAWVWLGVMLLWTTAKRFGGEAGSRRTTPTSGQETPPSVSVMSREEAYEVLGLTTGATSDEILASYRRLMKKVHPDQGGTTYLAMRLNQAKDVLLS